MICKWTHYGEFARRNSLKHVEEIDMKTFLGHTTIYILKNVKNKCACVYIWLETHCPGILVTPRLFLFYLNKSDPIRILSH